ncbi:hypothetical protein AAL_04185 [Moelleriella libera RCEF 2490]|uniref:Uncharacterized protein n=1 Tax=Moelleriella libera RCEF 2490 TaxID=1081109 RepID=A0A168BXY7_9HYPO|nr:hypothetical protein AAL_04185 [Moelleriella libera RCEF 2490]
MQFKSMVAMCLAGVAVAQSSNKLPPSPTNSGVCEPHDDHWHCSPASTSAAANAVSSAAGAVTSAVRSAAGAASSAASSALASASASAAKSCTPHNDHWHCPSGVSKPATPPAQTQTGAKPTASGDDHDHHGTDKECTPHNDHWHCPPGVSSPTLPPSAAATASKSSSVTGTPTRSSGAAANTTSVRAWANGRPSPSSGLAGIVAVVPVVAAVVFGAMML